MAVGRVLVSLVLLAGCGASAPQPREAAWTLVEADGRTLHLEVQAGGPPCDVITDVDVDEGPDAVTVSVTAGPEADADCGPGVAAVLGRFAVEAHLREPLGGRTLR